MNNMMKISEVLDEKISGEWGTESIDENGVNVLRTTNFSNEGIINYSEVVKRNISQSLVDKKKLLIGETIIDTVAIEEFLSSFDYPLYFLDFESFQPAVPLFDNSRPYQQIPFQYSLHYQKNKKSKLEHKEFLAEAGADPRIPFIKH